MLAMIGTCGSESIFGGHTLQIAGKHPVWAIQHKTYISLNISLNIRFVIFFLSLQSDKPLICYGYEKSHNFVFSPVHIRGTHQGKLFEEKDVEFILGEGMLLFFIPSCFALYLIFYFHIRLCTACLGLNHSFFTVKTQGYQLEYE